MRSGGKVQSVEIQILTDPITLDDSVKWPLWYHV